MSENGDTGQKPEGPKIDVNITYFPSTGAVEVNIDTQGMPHRRDLIYAAFGCAKEAVMAQAITQKIEREAAEKPDDSKILLLNEHLRRKQ